MPRIPGVNHTDAIRAFQRAGFRITRQSKHVVMFNGEFTIVIPRGKPVHAVTMATIVRDSGLTIDQFKALL